MTRVFCLTDKDGNLLPPSIQATVLAKYSRSPLSAAEIVSTLSAEEADKFQDKWLVTWGHSSVSELVTLPICFEGVSIVASKFIESYQRPGYSEKSTRYQKFSSASFITPPGAPTTMKMFTKRLYDAYDKLYPRVVKHCAELMGKDSNDPKVLEDRVVKARAFDNVRYLLPAGTGTNLGEVAFGRDFRYFIRDALGHSNPEIRMLGEMVRKAIGEICPPFIKDIEPDSFEPVISSLGRLPVEFNYNNPSWCVSLHRPRRMLDCGQDSDLVQRTFESMISERYGMSWSAFSKHMESRGNRSVPKIFRSIRLQFDVIIDYGAFRDLQRHRRCEQYSEPLTINYGYIIPDDIIGTDMEDEYKTAMDSVQSYEDENVIHDRDLSQYIIPLGYLHRTVFDVDLEELYYIVELRTRPQGHISYRRVAYKMFEIARDLYPKLMQWCRAISPNLIGEHR
jgi:thymidylate synthase ThyX